MPIRKHKKFNRPRKIFDSALIKEENNLITRYGLKSRREVWKAGFAIGKIRDLAKELITADEDKKKAFVERQAEKGFNVKTIADVLGLNKEDYLKRRLQSIIVAKKMATTYKQARQLITHKHVKMNGNYIDSPSHITTLKEEATLEMNLKLPMKDKLSDEEKQFLKSMKPKETPEEAQ